MKFISWTFLIVLMLIAALIRWRMNFTEYLVAGVDGTYYPLQVRSILEHFRLGYPDMPLVFFIEALFARFFSLFGVTDRESILFAVRIVDSVFPPLAAIPVFLISKELNKNKRTGLFVFLIITFSILNIFPLSLVSNFTKNSIAIVLIFFNIHFTLRLLKYSLRKDFYFILLTLIACLLTHFGSFSILLLYDGMFFWAWVWSNKSTFNKINYRKIVIPLFIFIFFLLLIAVFDFERLKRMLFFPFKIFEAPIILFVLEGFKTSLEGPKLFYLVIANLLSVTVLCWIIAGRNLTNPPEKIIAFSSAIITLILSSPLIGIEWEERFLNMSYVPLTILFLILMVNLKSKWLKYSLMTICFGLSFFPFVRGIPQPLKVNIEKQAYSELEDINKKIIFDSNDMIIARQDLRMIAGWIFRTKTSADFYFTKNDFARYNAVYILKQKGEEYANHVSAHFKEPYVSPDSRKIYDGVHFEIYKLDNTEHWNIGLKKPSKIFGEITEVSLNRLIIKNENVCRPVDISNTTTLHLNNNQTKLLPGQFVQVWGENKIFDIAIEAEVIQEITHGQDK